jgi:endonuclease/exonuclease/phosphatase (EEP) superfamily protein YafD
MRVENSTNKYIFYPVTAMLSGITAIIILQERIEFFRFFSNHAVSILFGIIALGLLFMVLRWQRLMFVAFVCAGCLCLFLRSSTNTSPRYASPNFSNDIEVLHINTSNHEGSYEELTVSLLKSDADFISVQEVTPDWDLALEILRTKYPYYRSVVSIGYNGMAVFSRLPFTELDTFYYKDIPNITGVIETPQKKDLRFICTYTEPPSGSDRFYEELREHFEVIKEKVGDSPATRLALGSYNTVVWSPEMKYFASVLGLKNSHRSTTPFDEGDFEHIFHSQELECSNFSKFYNEVGGYLGLRGRFQFKSTTVNPYAQQPTE